MIKGTERRAERPIDLRTAALAAVASRVSHSTTIVMLIAGAAQHVTVHVSTHVPIWQSIALVIGAAATTASAIAAWRAAGKSSDAARDARDALAASLKPHVELVFGEFHTREVAEPPVEVRAVVLGPLSPMGVAAVLPATDVRLQVNPLKRQAGLRVHADLATQRGAVSAGTSVSQRSDRRKER